MALTAFELIGTVEVKTAQAEQSIKRVDQKAQQLHSRFQKPLGDPFRNVPAQGARAESAIDRVNAKMRTAGTGSMAGAVIGANLLTAAVGAAAVALGAGGRAVLNYTARLEQLRIGFTTLLGSERAALEHLKEIEQFAAKTPFEFEDVARASQRFHNMGLETKKVLPLLAAVGDAVSATGGNSENIDRVTVALSQMIAKGKVSAEEMNQLSENLVGGWRILEQQLGITKAQAMKLAEQGKLSSDIFIKAFQDFAKVNYGGAMEKQARTFQGAMSTIEDSLLTTASTAFEPLYKKISEITVRISKEMSNGKVTLESGMRAMMEGASEIVGRAGVAAGEAFVNNLVNQISNVNLMDLYRRMQPFTYGLIKGAVDAVVDAGPASAQPADFVSPFFNKPAHRTPKFSASPKAAAGLSGGGGGGGGRGGGSSRDLLTEQQRSLEQGLRATLSTMQAEEEGIDRSYDQRRLKIASFYRAMSRLEEHRHQEILSTLNAETKLTNKIKDPAQRNDQLAELSIKKLEEGNRHRQATWELEDRVKEVTRERIALVDTLVSRLTREREVMKQINQERSRFANEVMRKDLGGGSFQLTPGLRDSIGRERFATLDEQVMREQMARRREILRAEMNGLANDFTGLFDRASEALIKTPGTFADKWKEAFREVGLGFADMLLDMANDLMRSQVLKLLERIAGLDPSDQSGAGGLLGRLTDSLTKKLGFGAMPATATTASGGAAGASMAAVINGGHQDTDRVVGAVGSQTAQLMASMASNTDRIIDGLTPRQESFLRGLAKAAISGAAAGATSALIGRESGGSAQTPNEGPPQPRPTRPPVMQFPNGRTTPVGGRASGGIINGPGTDTSDSILGVDRQGVPTAMVSRGEFVVNARATQKHRAALELINRTGELPKLGLGGFLKWTSPISHKSVRNVVMPIANQGFRNATMPVANLLGSENAGPQLSGGKTPIESSGNHNGAPVQHFHLGGVHIHTTDAQGIKRSRGQIERQMAASLQRAGRQMVA